MAKYKGKEITLLDDGRLYCDELEIYSSNFEEMKKAINATAEKAAKAPKIKVLFFNGWRSGEGDLIEGTAGASHGNNRVWVSWKSNRGNRRELKYYSDVFLDTEANRDLIKQKSELQAEIDKLEERRDEIMSKLERVKVGK